ncbi:hypothetical protein GCM10011613_07510 [Cellvibrio zantedeschiae]|uniref:Holin n=1 Tax=Cellvibrio zantedeschiae TaxID=1237077 RepID=A0ABQ3AS53_9GAMM|nr:hypothetical protein GCM10011613_07510 [Cellvibrio zantedeschiae]
MLLLSSPTGAPAEVVKLVLLIVLPFQLWVAVDYEEILKDDNINIKSINVIGLIAFAINFNSKTKVKSATNS